MQIPVHKGSLGTVRLGLSDFIEFIYMINHDGSDPRMRTPERILRLNGLSLEYLKEERGHEDDLVRIFIVFFMTNYDNFSSCSFKVHSLKFFYGSKWL